MVKSLTLTFVVGPPPILTCMPGSHRTIGPEPDGSYYVVAIAGGVGGGTSPYDFKFYWSDGAVFDTGSGGVDSRRFPGAPTAQPTKYVVTSADGQSCTNTT